jgi:hypothetical protein
VIGDQKKPGAIDVLVGEMGLRQGTSFAVLETVVK